MSLKVSLAVTHYNRSGLLIDAISGVVEDPRIDEIIIYDDASDSAHLISIADYFRNEKKVRVFSQVVNVGMMQNKFDAVSVCSNEWVILFDSDNVIGKEYLDALESLPKLDPAVIYCPDFAYPNFDFRASRRLMITDVNVDRLIQSDSINMLLNCCNYVVNRKEYVECYESIPTIEGIKATDTIWFAYHWLKRSGSFYVVPEMQYFHRVHDQSGFLQDASYNMRKGEEIRSLIKQL